MDPRFELFIREKKSASATFPLPPFNGIAPR